MKFRYLQPALLGTSALIFAGAQFTPREQQVQNGPVLEAAANFIAPKIDSATPVVARANTVGGFTKTALTALAGSVRQLSQPQALEGAFKSYFAYKAQHPNDVKKP